jgi:hypothetical protein
MKVLTLLAAMLISTSAFADITFMVPQKPGQGTSVWAEIVAKEFAKTPAMNGENIIISYNPGARDMAGFNKFHATERFEAGTVMVSHGGNGISYVQEKVDYDYDKYDSICHQNLNIIMAKHKGVNENDGISHVAGSGMVPEGLAIAMMIGGPGKTVDEYVTIFKNKVTWVNGLTGSERHLAFTRGEILATRANPAQYLSKVMPLVREGKVETWLHHGVLDLATGKSKDDINYPGKRFEDVFKAKWGVFPSGDTYDAYTMIHTWRDSIQKALWVNKGNPNTERLRTACKQMSENPESVAILEKKIGKYDWVTGTDGNKTVSILKGMITEPALRALVKFNTEALGLASVYKANLVSGATVIEEVKIESPWYKFW